MPAAFNEIGVKCVSATLVESAEVEKSVDHTVIKTNIGEFAQGHRFDPVFSFSLKGRGPALETLLGGNSAAYLPDQLGAGKIIISSVKNSQTNEDFDSFEVSGMCYPAAGGG